VTENGRLERFADLVVRVGANVQPGSGVWLLHNTLFDENAACHVAWGQSFPFAVADGLAKSNEERYEIGLNHSAVHTDVVIGGDGMTVTGAGPKGTVDIIRDDEWVLRA
jgi:aminopeptidase